MVSSFFPDLYHNKKRPLKTSTTYDGFSEEQMSKKRLKKRSKYGPNFDPDITLAQRKKPRVGRLRIETRDQPLPKFLSVAYYYPPSPYRAGVRKYDTSWALSKKRVNNIRYCHDTVRNPYYLGVKPKDDGGPLLSYKIRWHEATVPVSFTRDQGLNTYSYDLPAATGGYHLGDEPHTRMIPPDVDLHAFEYAAEAWQKARPAKLDVSGLQAIYELRDLPRMLSKRALEFTKLGDRYLEYQFGWRPFVNDVQSLLFNARRISKQVDFILANIGKPIRRRLLVKEDVQNEIFLNRTGYPYSGCWATNDILSGKPRISSQWYHKGEVRTITKVVFSGEFVYSFTDRIPSRKELELRLRGFEFTPSTVWELIPWSWLIDWFSNVGDVIHNLSREVADEQHTTYAYIQKHTRRDYKWSGCDGYYRPSVIRQFDTKVREATHPFGLALDRDSLTGSQKLIIAALADQKIRNVL